MQLKSKVLAIALRNNTHWLLVIYDSLVFFLCNVFFLFFTSTNQSITWPTFGLHFFISLAVLLSVRFIFRIYRIIWRYGGTGSYLRLIVSDAWAGFIYYVLHVLLNYWNPVLFPRFPFQTLVVLYCCSLLFSLCTRMIYRFLYRDLLPSSKNAPFVRNILRFLGSNLPDSSPKEEKKRRIVTAIYGAGRVGVSLCSEMITNSASIYKPVCFIDSNPAMKGRFINRLPVVNDQTATQEYLGSLNVQEIVIANTNLSRETCEIVARNFEDIGFSVKYYDMPIVKNSNGKNVIATFKPEDLLFRRQLNVVSQSTFDYYKDKTILITGGGGSIGSELCRQLAPMTPKRIIILDIFENGAYDVQTELRQKYDSSLCVNVEICSVCNREALRRVFEEYRPEIVIHAAAHKHVPLMEKNCIEAVENNVFGTLNTVELCQEYNVDHFLMVSTDKAVNPTNIMGATKRMCEMLVMSRVGQGKTVFTATRFGNVLGSAGSVIPLFRRQIESGGPVTVTDKRIIRYFMTIPEASQLVLTSGAMAKDGELFVLDMGEPVKIYDLAKTMITLYGLVPEKDIEIREIGLREGEKLYEELLVKGDHIERTENNLIFIEREGHLSPEEVEKKLNILRDAVKVSDGAVREALHAVVPTFHAPEEINSKNKKA